MKVLLVILLSLSATFINIQAFGNTVEELDAYYDCIEEIDLQYKKPELIKELKKECECEELKECK